jgi:hypothetical protein
VLTSAANRFDAEVALRRIKSNTVALGSAARMCVEQRDPGHCDFARQLVPHIRRDLKYIGDYARAR